MARLGDVVRIDRRAVQPDAIADGQAYLGLENIETGGRITSVASVRAGELKSAKFAFDQRHVLFGKLRPNLAKVARPDFAGVCSTDIVPLLPAPGVDRDYLAQFLLAPSTVQWATSRTAGVNLPRLSPSVLESLEIPLPPLPEQRRIASILDRVDAVRVQRHRALVLAREAEEAALRGLLTRDHGNRTVLVGELADVQTGPFGSLLHKGDYVRGGIPLINPTHIRNGRIFPDPEFSVTEEKYAELSNYGLRPGDVVLGRRGEMGRAAVVDCIHGRLMCGTGSLILRPRAGLVLGTVLAGMLSSPAARRSLEERAQGVTMLNLNQVIVSNLVVSVAPLAAQRDFKELQDQLAASRDRQLKHLAKLDELFASLQHRAFRGEL